MLGGNQWVGGGHGKIIPPVGMGHLPSEEEGGLVFRFRLVEFLNGDQVTSHGEDDKVVHRVHLAHPVRRLKLATDPPKNGLP